MESSVRVHSIDPFDSRQTHSILTYSTGGDNSLIGLRQNDQSENSMSIGRSNHSALQTSSNDIGVRTKVALSDADMHKYEWNESLMIKKTNQELFLM